MPSIQTAGEASRGFRLKAESNIGLDDKTLLPIFENYWLDHNTEDLEHVIHVLAQIQRPI